MVHIKHMMVCQRRTETNLSMEDELLQIVTGVTNENSIVKSKSNRELIGLR